MYLALSICVLFFSPMQSVNGAKFLNATSLLTISGCADASNGSIDIVPLTSVYASL